MTRSTPVLTGAPPEVRLGASFVVATRALLALTLLAGVAYPLVVTGAATALFPSEARGSLVSVDGAVRGSRLLGQEWSAPRYFFGRPSATSPKPYDASASGGSNLGPTNPALTERARARLEALTAAGGTAGPTPIELVTASGSGLDPHISPPAAEAQVARVARVRGLTESRVRELVRASTTGRTAGVLGEPVVNVLLLNLALDREPSP